MTLAEALVLAKTQRMFFAITVQNLVCKIVIRKKPLTTNDLTELPKGAPISRGVCQVRDGKLCFDVKGDAPVAQEALAKHTLQVERQIARAIKGHLTPIVPVVVRYVGEEIEENVPVKEEDHDGGQVETGPIETGPIETGPIETGPMESTSGSEEEVPSTEVRIATLLRQEIESYTEEIHELRGANKQAVALLLTEFSFNLRRKDLHAAADLARQIREMIEEHRRTTRHTREWVQTLNLGERHLGVRLGKGGVGEVRALNAPNQGGPPLVAKLLTVNADRDLLGDEERIYVEVGDHPNLPRCGGIHEIDGRRALVLEQVQGKNLQDVSAELRRFGDGALEPEQRKLVYRYLGSQLLSVVEHVGKRGFVHSDIKPDNVMIDGVTGKLKLIDVGGAVRVGKRVGQSTPDYRAPESKNLSPAFDVFSLGKALGVLIPTKDRTRELQSMLDRMVDNDPSKRPTVSEVLASEYFAGAPLEEEAEKAEALLRSFMVTFTTTEGFDRVSFEATVKSCLEVYPTLPEQLTQPIGSMLEALAKPELSWRRLSREEQWAEKAEVMTKARLVLDELKEALTALRPGSPLQLQRYLDGLQREVIARRNEIERIEKLGPLVLTQQEFRKVWQAIRSRADESYARSRVAVRNKLKIQENTPKDVFPDLQARVKSNLFHARNSARVRKAPDEEIEALNDSRPGVLDGEVEKWTKIFTTTRYTRQKSVADLLGLHQKFGKALDRFEAAGKSSFEESRSAALLIAKDYFQRARKLNSLGIDANFNDVSNEPFLENLMVELNDLISSIVQRPPPQ